MAKRTSKKGASEGVSEPAETNRWRSRIVGEADVAPGELRAHPENWREHPAKQQQALARVISEVGWIQRVIVNRRTGRMLDGHCRVELALERDELSVPVLYVDISEEEERVILATFDPISALATENKERLRGVLDQIKEGREALLQTIGLLKQGFRTGAGYVTEGVKEWKDAETFFAMPEWLAPIWEQTDELIVEFSGGKDSTAAALWVAHHKGDKKLTLAFVDPGVEFPGITAHIQDVAQFLNCDFDILRPKQDWWAWIAREGWPSLLFRPCALDFIHKPFAEFVRKHEEGRTIVFTGSRAEEAVRGSKKTERSELQSLGSKASRYQHFAPAFAAKKETLEQVIAASGVPLWEGYSRGFVRTACWCCPGQCGKQAVALQKNYPGLCDDIRRWEKRVGILRPSETQARSFDDLVGAGERALERAQKASESTAAAE
ncbi:MAG: phosphoadenosine phosphosulfate reductase family protein [Trueperaceae bacterium]